MKRARYLNLLIMLSTLVGCFSKEASESYGLKSRPSAPTELELSSPSTTYGKNPNPIILVKGVSSGNNIRIFTDSECLNQVGAAPALASSVLVTVSVPISNGTHQFYANASNAIGSSACSSTGVTYILGDEPLSPSNITLHDPVINSSDDTTPTLLIDGVVPNDIVRLFIDQDCQLQRGEAVVATGASSVLITATPALPPGNYLFYANSSNIYGASGCTLISIAYSLSTAPNPPNLITLGSPATSPHYDTTPEIILHGVANGYTIKFYSNSTCTGAPLKTQTSTGSTLNITLNALAYSNYTFYATSENIFGVSVCSSTTGVSLAYNVGALPTNPSSLTLASPISTPGVNALPTISINGVVNGNTVRLFTNNACTGVPITSTASGASKEITLAIPLTVGTHQFYANTSNIYGTSGCSGPLSYTYETCPSGYLHVPRNTAVETNSDFCVMKYEAKAYHSASQTIDADGCNEAGCTTANWGLANHIPASSSTGSPWRRISPTNASVECNSLNALNGVSNKYDLISNPEWMTIARNAEGVSSNFEAGVMARGWAANNTSVTPYDPWQNSAVASSTGTDCKYNIAANSCASTGNHLYRRTLTLSNGEEIWDLSSNVWEWVDWSHITSGFQDGPKTCAASWVEFPVAASYACLSGLANQVFPATSNGSSVEGFGRFYGGSGGAAVRGGGWGAGTYAGALALALDASTSFTHASYGFRCVYRP